MQSFHRQEAYQLWFPFYQLYFSNVIIQIICLFDIVYFFSMDIGSEFIINYAVFWYNEPVAFRFGEISLYLIGCMNLSLIISNNTSQQSNPISQQQVHQRIQQQIPIGTAIPQHEIELYKQPMDNNNQIE
ncbi:hypothetical protein pb186bvf_016937 [Paramecium bursaria]